MAKDIAKVNKRKVEEHRWKMLFEQLSGMMDVWMKFEHRDVWEQAEQIKTLRAEEDETNINIMAEDMAEMRKLLMDLSDMD